MVKISKTKNNLYGLSRMFGKAASTLNDIETIASGNPKRIFKRFKNKTIRRNANKLLNKTLNKR